MHIHTRQPCPHFFTLPAPWGRDRSLIALIWGRLTSSPGLGLDPPSLLGPVWAAPPSSQHTDLPPLPLPETSWFLLRCHALDFSSRILWTGVQMGIH